MVSLGKGHARLEISASDFFGDVSEAVHVLFQLCRVNNLRAALIVSHQGPTDWRSSIRVAIKFSHIKSTSESKLALVVQGTQARQRDDVCDAAKDVGLTCRVFEDEPKALAWLMEPGLRVLPAA